MLAFGVEPRLIGVGEPLFIARRVVVGQRPPHRRFQLVEQRVHLLTDLKPQVVAEIVLGPGHQKGLRRRRVRIAPLLHDQQP